jgi:hypothetical protein
MSEIDAMTKLELSNEIKKLQRQVDTQFDAAYKLGVKEGRSEWAKAHTLITFYDSFLTDKGLEQEFSEWISNGIE